MINTLGISGVTASTGTYTGAFFYKKIIDSMAFDTMMREEDIKSRFKEELAYELAKQLIASNRTTFTYSRDNFGDQYILKAEVKL